MPNQGRPLTLVSNSGANAANAQVVDTGDVDTVLDVWSFTNGAGTHTLLIEVSVDATTWLTVDSLVAAATQVKHYGPTSVGAAAAVCPLAFRYVRVTAGAAGVGITTTMVVTAK